MRPSSVATFISGEDSTAVLTGLTLTNGYTTITGGGGIRIENSSPRLKNLKILNSVANVGGGGISCEACDSRITDVVIANNSVTGIGGGMRMFNGSNPELLGVTVTNNTSTLNGGGIAYEGLPASTIEQRLHRVTVSGNRSSQRVLVEASTFIPPSRRLRALSFKTTQPVLKVGVCRSSGHQSLRLRIVLCQETRSPMVSKGRTCTLESRIS